MKRNSQNRFNSLRRIFLGAIGIGIFVCLSNGVVRAATVSVDVAADGLKFTPSSVSIQVGDTVTWTWKANGHSVTSGVPNNPNGLFDSGIKSSGSTFSHVFTEVGSFPYFCMPHGACCGMVGTVTVAAPTPTPSPGATRPLNISTRLEVRTGDQVLIEGFIVSGSAPKRIVLRAIGPSLSAANISNPLPDPILELHGADGSLITTNDNWKDPAQSDIEATGFAPSDARESALVRTLDPGSYTLVMSGKGGTTGVGLFEAYDLDSTGESQLTNISTRGFVGTANDVMIGGFVLGGENGGNATVIIRALGPSLTPLRVAGALADPTLELHDEQGVVIESNDDWKATQQDVIEATGFAPPDDLDSAILKTLPPGSYTAVVAGKNGLTGVALVEVYLLP
jgi:plastocyanin